MQNKIIETHCHLDYLISDSLDSIIKDANELHVEKILTISVEPKNFKMVKDISAKYSCVYYTQGIHPHHADQCEQKFLDQITKSCHEQKMLAVGEIGLDYYYNNSPKKDQRYAFTKQLEIAINENKPVVIHSREADDDMIHILNDYAKDLKAKGVIHSFTSSLKLAQCALENDFYLGFNGIITFKNADLVREAVKLCPLEKILTETDAPFLTPIPHRGKENTPKYLPFIIQKIAEIKSLAPEEITNQTYQNALELFEF